MLKCNIKYRMVDKGIDELIDLMRATGLTRNTLNKLYKNQNLETMKLETLILVCDALDCSLSELIEYIPDKSQ